MKKILSMIAVLALISFSAMVFAADAAKPAATPAKPAAAQAAPASPAAPATPAAPANPLAEKAAKTNASVMSHAMKALSGEIIVGKIKKIDVNAGTITIKDQTITVKPDQVKDIKEGEKVKVTLASGTMNAEKVVSLEKKATKKKAKKEVKQVEAKAVQSATDAAVEKAAQGQ